MKNTSLPIIDIKKYGGKQVAIVNKKIIASGRTTREVLARAKQRSPKLAKRDILLVSVPKSLTVVYLL